jgi:hypothetical protein
MEKLNNIYIYIYIYIYNIYICIYAKLILYINQIVNETTQREKYELEWRSFDYLLLGKIVNFIN